MTNPDDNETGGEFQIGDIFAALMSYRHLIWHATVAFTALTMLAGAVYFFWQPTLWTASLDFRPVFPGSGSSRYPNDLPFGPTDIVDGTVLDQVYDKNHVQDFCARAEFRGGFVVEESSPELQFLDLDYQARLADTKLTVVEREKLQSDYHSHRLTLPMQYRLAWQRPEACRTMPPATAFKALGEVLETWAEDSDQKRGVLRADITVFSPGILDFASFNQHSLLIRSDLVRSALDRVIANITLVQALPGAGLVRIGKEGASFLQVRARVEDIIRADLDPLVGMVGSAFGIDARAWAEQALADASGRYKAAEDRATAYQTALREYAGATAAPLPAGAQRPQAPNDVQNLTPLIDKTFVDKIGELSAPSTAFRQEMTRSMVREKVAAVQLSSSVEHYRQLVASLKNGTASSLGAAEGERRLVGIIAAGKEQVVLFNALYDEYSRVSFRPGPAMYHVERPAIGQSLRSFSVRNYLLLVIGVFFGAPMIVGLGCLAHHALRQIARRPLRT